MSEFKERDPVFVVIFRKPAINLATRQIRPPTFISLEGTVEYVLDVQPNVKVLSVQIPSWPLRYLIEQSQAFANTVDAEKAVVERNAQIHVKR